VRLKPELKGALLALTGVALVLAGVWLVLGLRLRIWTYHEYDRYVWLTANLPVAHALWHHKIKAAEDVEQVIKQWRPHMTNRFDRWVELRWVPGGPSQDTISFIGIWALAKDGKLVSASSYSDDGLLCRMFFDSLTHQEKSGYRAALEAHVDTLHAKRQNSVQQDGAANRSQPILLETNGTSSAAGSRP
jgi:hypothetical protein